MKLPKADKKLMAVESMRNDWMTYRVWKLLSCIPVPINGNFAGGLCHSRDGDAEGANQGVHGRKSAFHK
jgi:hypothetical protein